MTEVSSQPLSQPVADSRVKYSYSVQGISLFRSFFTSSCKICQSTYLDQQIENPIEDQNSPSMITRVANWIDSKKFALKKRFGFVQEVREETSRKIVKYVITFASILNVSEHYNHIF